MTDQEKMKIIEDALDTPEGRQALQDAMIEPKRITIDYETQRIRNDYQNFMDKIEDRLI